MPAPAENSSTPDDSARTESNTLQRWPADTNSAMPGPVVLHVSLTALRIDPAQPRQYLPEDVRSALVETCDSEQALKTLMTRATQGDAVAAGYLESIRTLARSIHDMGLQQPIRVIPDDAYTFRIVDGERRFWAYLYLLVTRPEGPYQRIPALLHDAQASPEQLLRAQWAANQCREAVPAVDIAEAIHMIHRHAYQRVLRERDQVRAELGDAADADSPTELVMRLTQHQLTPLMSRSLHPRQIYSYLAVADRLFPEAKALARAHSLSLRQLVGLSRYAQADQVAAIAKMAGVANMTKPASQAVQSKSRRPGRPTLVHRSVQTCVTMRGALERLSVRSLVRCSDEDFDSLEEELERAAAQIDRVRQLVKRIL